MSQTGGWRRGRRAAEREIFTLRCVAKSIASWRIHRKVVEATVPNQYPFDI
jgi:hypothetical protein